MSLVGNIDHRPNAEEALETANKILRKIQKTNLFDRFKKLFSIGKKSEIIAKYRNMFPKQQTKTDTTKNEKRPDREAHFEAIANQWLQQQTRRFLNMAASHFGEPYNKTLMLMNDDHRAQLMEVGEFRSIIDNAQPVAQQQVDELMNNGELRASLLNIYIGNGPAEFGSATEIMSNKGDIPPTHISAPKKPIEGIETSMNTTRELLIPDTKIERRTQKTPLDSTVINKYYGDTEIAFEDILTSSNSDAYKKTILKSDEVAVEDTIVEGEYDAEAFEQNMSPEARSMEFDQELDGDTFEKTTIMESTEQKRIHDFGIALYRHNPMDMKEDEFITLYEHVQDEITNNGAVSAYLQQSSSTENPINIQSMIKFLRKNRLVRDIIYETLQTEATLEASINRTVVKNNKKLAALQNSINAFINKDENQTDQTNIIRQVESLAGQIRVHLETITRNNGSRYVRNQLINNAAEIFESIESTLQKHASNDISDENRDLLKKVCEAVVQNTQPLNNEPELKIYAITFRQQLEELNK